MGQQPQPWDWHRIFFGQEPPTYFVELLIRAIVVFAVLMLSMRLLGKRMSSQLSRTEMVALVSLAAAIGVPMLSADRGLLGAVAIALVVVVIARTVATLSRRSSQVESLVQGQMTILVNDGVLCVDRLAATRVTRERVFAQLRSKGLRHLGGVQRLYLEAEGTFSVVAQEPARPGLSIIPDWDEDFVGELKPATNRICGNCGAGAESSRCCGNCGAARWVSAVV
jgi:hypothetical protein